jgi:hypothetical protein
MVVNGSFFKLGVNGRSFVTISVGGWTLKGGMLALIRKGADFLVILIDFPLRNWNVSIDLIDSAFIILRVICFKWRHIVRRLILRFFYLYIIIP